MGRDINVLNKAFRLFNRLLMSGIAFLIRFLVVVVIVKKMQPKALDTEQVIASNVFRLHERPIYVPSAGARRSVHLFDFTVFGKTRNVLLLFIFILLYCMW